MSYHHEVVSESCQTLDRGSLFLIFGFLYWLENTEKYSLTICLPKSAPNCQFHLARILLICEKSFCSPMKMWPSETMDVWSILSHIVSTAPFGTPNIFVGHIGTTWRREKPMLTIRVLLPEKAFKARIFGGAVDRDLFHPHRTQTHVLVPFNYTICCSSLSLNQLAHHLSVPRRWREWIGKYLLWVRSGGACTARVGQGGVLSQRSSRRIVRSFGLSRPKLLHFILQFQIESQLVSWHY